MDFNELKALMGEALNKEMDKLIDKKVEQFKQELIQEKDKLLGAVIYKTNEYLGGDGVLKITFDLTRKSLESRQSHF